jgi:hypothetical protein
LQQRLAHFSPDFAYPFGGIADCREEQRELIHAAGYRTCFSCHGGLIRPGDDAYHLRRIAISPRYHLTPSAWERRYANFLDECVRLEPAAA